MAPNNFSTMLHKRTNRITRVLIYAFLEWTLIFLLLLNSLFSYFILKFTLYFGLKPPCVLCSRIDHHLDSHKKDKQTKQNFSSYICEQHVAEISKFGYCSNHRKLVEVQNMCDNCSSTSHDPQLFRWMTEIGIVKDHVLADDISKRCSCCDGMIKNSSISKVSSLEFEITERELLVGNIADQNEQVNTDQFDDSKFGYQILDDGAEEDDDEQQQSEEVILKAEKEPLLQTSIDSNNDNKKEIITTQNLDPDMLPQHLDFYIDHDNHRLIPFELVDDSSIQVVKQEEKKGTSENSREFKLVFDGYELALPKCESSTIKDLPSIQEEEESVIENLQIPKDEGTTDYSENFELILKGDKLLQEPKIESMQIPQDVKQVECSENIKLNFEAGEVVSRREMISENLLKEEEEESEIEKLQIRDDNEDEEDSQILELIQEEKEKETENSFIIEEQKVIAPESASILDEQESCNQAIIEAESQANVETHSTSSESEDNAYHLENRDNYNEEKNQSETDRLSIKEPEVLASHLSNVDTETEGYQNPTDKRLIQEWEKNLASHSSNVDIETEGNENLGDKPVIQEFEEDLASHSSNVDIETEGHQNSADKPLIQEFTEDVVLHLRNHEIENINESSQNLTAGEHLTFYKVESHTIADEVDAEITHDTDVTERGLNANVGMSHNEVEEERAPDTPTSSESSSHLHRKISFLGRRESATEESLDGMSMISEHESGEAVEKLKVDLLAERKALKALYKELEEERNAAAIAANQTMAMITRLQEEKATMQMEALQYQRMMEEQSEYDQEALQMMNELVVKREKEKQELEKELEVYRKKVMDYEEKEKLRILCRRRSRNSSASCSYGEESDGLSVDLNQEVKDQEEYGGISSHNREENGQQDTPTDAVLCLQDSLSGFEEERQAILDKLKVLEEKLCTLAEEEEEHFDNMKPFEQFCEENGKDFDVSSNGGDIDSNGFIHANGNHQQERKINGPMPKRLLPLFDATDLLDSPNGELNGHEDEIHHTKFELEKKRFAIEEEVDHVYERLQALEADREFLKHCIGSIRKGDKGLDLLQEILQHLCDLKNVEVQALKNTDQCASV